MKIVSTRDPTKAYNLPSFCVACDKDGMLGRVIIFNGNQSLRGRQKIFYISLVIVATVEFTLCQQEWTNSHSYIQPLSLSPTPLFSSFADPPPLHPHPCSCHSSKSDTSNWMDVNRIGNGFRFLFIVKRAGKTKQDKKKTPVPCGRSQSFLQPAWSLRWVPQAFRASFVLQLFLT